MPRSFICQTTIYALLILAAFGGIKIAVMQITITGLERELKTSSDANQFCTSSLDNCYVDLVEARYKILDAIERTVEYCRG